MDDSSLMTYNTFTFKTEPEMLLHARFGKIMDKNFFKNSKNMAALVFATIVFGISKECLRPQLYL